jgi:polysaccharide biosynthesis transport protein
VPSSGHHSPPSTGISTGPLEELPAAPPMDVRALIGGVLQRWKLITAIPVILLVLTAAVLRVIPPRYVSGVELLMFDPQQVGVGGLDQRAISGRDFDTEALTTEMAVISSTSLAGRVVKDLDLAKDPEFQRHSRLAALGLSGNGWAATRVRELLRSVGLGNRVSANSDRELRHPPSENEAEEVATALLLNHIRVAQVPFSYVLDVSATSRSPEMAQRIAAAVVDDYLAGVREGRQQALQQMAIWLRAKLAELKSRVVEAQTTIEKLKSESALSDAGKGNVSERQIVSLNAQLMGVRADVNERRAQLERARQPGGSAGSAHVPANLQNSRALYDLATQREQSLEASLQRLTASQHDSGDYVKLQQVQRIADADTKLYDTYLSQYNEIDSRGSLDAFEPKIISAATVPAEPSFPPTTMLYTAAGVSGVGLGIVLAFLLDYFQGNVKTSAQAQSTFGHPVIGALPLVREGRSRGADKLRALVQVVVDAPMSALSEAIRAVRISLHLSNPERLPMVVLVTSSLPGEGKSSIAMLLAASSAGAGERTVVVDCDLRSRTISQAFGEQQPGLADVLNGNADIAAVAVRHPIAGCDVLPAGSRVQAPADLLASRRLTELIAALRERYAYVIIDAPPLLSVVDPVALATIADRILIAIDGSHTRSQSIAESFRLLQPETDRVAGMVFNKVAPDQLRRYGAGGAYY